MRYLKFDDIPRFTQNGDYCVSVAVHRIVATIDSYIAESGLNLDPDFQRSLVWTKAQQQSYVEYILSGGLTGRTIYLNSPSWRTSVPKGAYDEFVLVDGKQRIAAWRAFWNDQVKAFGSFASEFKGHAILNSNCMVVNVNNLKTRAEVLSWYLGINGAGKPHSPAELKRVRQMLDLELESTRD